MLLLFFGLKSHYTLQKKITRLTYLFVYYIITIAIFFVYEFFWPHIKFLFLVLILSALGQSFQLRMLFDQVEEYIKDDNARLIKAILYIHKFIIFLLLFTGFPKVTSICTNEMVYPLCFQVLMITHLFIFVFALVMHRN